MKQSTAQKLNSEAETKQAKLNARLAELIAKKEEYVTRLDEGAIRIEQARAQRKDVSEWENYWIQLLRGYEAVCDKVRLLQKQGAVTENE